MLCILLLVSSLTFNQSSKSARDYPDGFQRVHERCQADVSRLAMHLLECVFPVKGNVLERAKEASTMKLITISQQ